MTATDDHARPGGGSDAASDLDDAARSRSASGSTSDVDAHTRPGGAGGESGAGVLPSGGDDDATPAADATAPAPPARPRLADAVVALRIPEFRRFWFAAIASNSGSWLQALATPYVMFQITESGAWVGAAVFSIMLPMALVGPIAGPLADRIPRRTILLAAQSAMAVAGMAFAVAWWSGVRSPWAYLGMSVVYGTFNGFSMPAWQAFVADLVPRELLMNAITLNSTQFNAARAIGPSIGGVVLATAGPGWAFAGNAASFLVVVAVLRTLAPPVRGERAPSESPLRAFVAGGRYARKRPGIMTGYLTALVLSFFGGTLVQVHLILFAEKVFEVDALFYGILVAAYGTGAIAAAPWLAAVGPTLPRSKVLVVGLTAFGIGELLLVATEVFVVGVIGVVIAGASHITLAATTNTAIQLQVTESMRGRVLSMYLMVFTLGMPIGALVQGPASDALGPRVVVGVMGTMMILSAVAFALSGRARSFDDDLVE